MTPVLTLPGAPILLGCVGGRLDPGRELRQRCRAAIEASLPGVDRVIVVSVGSSTAGWPAGQPYDVGRLIGRHRSAIPAPGAAALPLGLAIGRDLVRSAGWQGALRLQSVAAATPAEDCSGLATALHPGPTDLLVAVGDGSVLRRPLGPGPVHPAAAGFDRSVLEAWRSGDRDALIGLDADLAAELRCTGRVPWQVLAAGCPEVSQARVHYADDPYGVFYLIASWR